MGSITQRGRSAASASTSAAKSASGAGPAAYLLVGVRRDHRDEALRELLLQLTIAGLGALSALALALMIVAGKHLNLTLFGLIIAFLVVGALRKVPVYEAFVEGAKEGFDVAKSLLPYLIAMLCAIGALRASGALDFGLEGIRWLVEALGWDTRFVDALPTALVKPFSGSAARAGSAGPKGSAAPCASRCACASRMIRSEFSFASSEVSPQAVMPCPPRMVPIACGLARAISAMSSRRRTGLASVRRPTARRASRTDRAWMRPSNSRETMPSRAAVSSRASSRAALRAGLALAVIAAVLLIWADGAVGVF